MSNYVNPSWVEEGMEVFIPWSREKNRPGRDSNGTAARCKVAVATGDHARVVNEKLQVDRWYSLYDLFVPKDDPHV